MDQSAGRARGACPKRAVGWIRGSAERATAAGGGGRGPVGRPGRRVWGRDDAGVARGWGEDVLGDRTESAWNCQLGAGSAAPAANVGAGRFHQPPPVTGTARHAFQNAAVASHEGVARSAGQDDADSIREELARILGAGGEGAALVVDLMLETKEEKSRSSQASKFCKFCLNNNEEEIYHEFKDSLGRVLCPVLSRHVCELCGASGQGAHTRKYCPLNPLTRGEPERRGFPPGIMPLDVLNTTLDKLKSLNVNETTPR